MFHKTKPEVWASQNVEQHEHRKLKRNGSREAQSCPMSSLLSFQPLNTWSPLFLLLFNLQTCPLVPEFPLGFIVQFSYTSGVVSEILYTCYLHRFERDSVSLCWGRGTLSTLDLMCWFIQDRALLKVQCGLWLISSLNVPLKDYNLSGILTMLSLNLILLIFFFLFFWGGGVSILLMFLLLSFLFLSVNTLHGQIPKPPVNVVSNTLWRWMLAACWDTIQLPNCITSFWGSWTFQVNKLPVPRLMEACEDGIYFDFLRIFKKNGWHE